MDGRHHRTTADDRSRENIERLYLAGLNHREIGVKVGYSHEQVRQLLKQWGMEKTPVGQRRYAVATAGRDSELRREFLRLRNDAAVAIELGMDQAHVHRWANEHIPEATLLRRHPRTKHTQHSDDEMVNALLDAAAHRPSPLTSDVYQEWTRAQNAGRKAKPGPQGIMLRFGSWRDALTRAGLPANPRSGAQATYDLDDALDAIAACWKELGRYPSVERYEGWRKTKTGTPSSATSRRLAGSWDDLLIAAYPFVYGLALGTPTADTSSHTPPKNSVGTPYTHANEDCAVLASDPFERDPQLLERALSNHARLQNALADLAIQAGFECLSPAEDDPPFDIAWYRQDGVLAVVEVKSAAPHNLESQMRLGLGQILRYAQLLRDGDHGVAPVLAVEIPPDDGWARLCAAVGVTIVWPGVLENALG